MDEEIDRLVIGVRADTAGFARDVQQMRESLEGPLGQGADKAGRMIETSLVRAVTSGKLGFDSLRTVALGALESIEASALKIGLGAVFGGSAGGGGLGASLGGVLGGLLGLPGRATGGPVSPGAAYLVGERGPELFVPGGSGRVETHAAVRRLMQGRDGGSTAPTMVKHGDIHFSLTVQSNGGDAQEIVRLARSTFRAEMARMQRDQRGLLSD